MLSKDKYVEETLYDALVTDSYTKDASYSLRGNQWKDSIKGINFWDFLSVNYLELDRFFTLLDVETGPDSGWEKFMDVLGLSLWEERRWCYQYHNGLGPTRAALTRLIDRNIYEENLTLASVLEIIEEMGRYDIVLQINWKDLIENFKSKKQFIAQNPKDARTLHFDINKKFESDKLSRSECVLSSNVAFSDKEFNLKSQKRSKAANSAPCILFSYASDAEDFAQKVANQLRSGDEGSRVKIVMIGDARTKRALVMDHSNILHKWFNQVRYVVPILSPNYLKQIQNISFPDCDQDVALYNRLLYRLSMDQFVSFGSRNLRCRPLCPMEFASQVKDNVTVQSNGLFSINWRCESDAEVEDFRLVLHDEPLI